MFEFRVTKYDPSRRDRDGTYQHCEWTSFEDIGNSFDGVTPAVADDLRIEKAYVAAAIAFMSEAGVDTLLVSGLENPRDVFLPFGSGSALNREEVAEAIRRMLREGFWCRLEADGGFIHVV